MHRLPSLKRQKEFIIENSNILNIESKNAILSILLMEVESDVIMESKNKQNIDIDLDKVEQKNKSTITHIYNIVLSRVENLKNPAR